MLGKYVIVIESDKQEDFKDFGEGLEQDLNGCGYKIKYYRFQNIKSLE